MYSKYFWKTLKLQAIIHRKDKKRLIFSPLHIYSSIYIGAKICIITCIFSIYLCPVKKVFSIKDDTHRDSRENTKAVTIENCVIMQIVFPLQYQYSRQCRIHTMLADGIFTEYWLKKQKNSI